MSLKERGACYRGWGSGIAAPQSRGESTKVTLHYKTSRKMLEKPGGYSETIRLMCCAG